MPPEQRATLEAAVKLGLTPDEYAHICTIQGGEPTYVELAIYSVMWSEHCSYKHSRPVLGRFPSSGPRILQGPGENAGIIDVGDGWAVAMKVESHNHPSAVEPFQGAATGVGGIVRDIFTMGARPCVALDSLRFGEIDGPENARQRFLFDGVVGGIGFYGNCLGIPTVGGEVYFEDTYAGNCLVNAMSAGLMRADQIVRAFAEGPGNHVVLIGSKTGRDGIGGASVLASQQFDETLEEKRPSVQVGDPFTEKKLIEACLELLHRGLVVSMQDLGAAGLTSSSSEMASKGHVGLDIHADRVPLREADMEPWEIMISESQERMLSIVDPARMADVRRGLRALGPRLHRDRRGHRLHHAAHHLARRARGRHPGAPPGRRIARHPHPVVQARPPGRRAARRKRRRLPRAGRHGRRAARAAGRAQHRQQALGLRAVRLHRAGQHRADPGLRRRRAAHQGHRSAASPSSTTATGATATSTPTAAPRRPWPRRPAT